MDWWIDGSRRQSRHLNQPSGNALGNAPATPWVANLVDFHALVITAVGSLVENGTQQDVSVFFHLSPGEVLVQSDIDVPEPSALAIFAVAAGALLVLRSRSMCGVLASDRSVVQEALK